MNTFPTAIKDYAKLYNNVFSKEFCEKTIESLDNSTWYKHQFYNVNEEYVHVGDDFLQTKSDIFEKKHINETLWHVINQYVTKEFSECYQQFRWFGSWKGYTDVKFHKYDTGTNMKIHCDHIYDIFDGTIKGVPILTIVGLLNEDFEGGDFLLWEKEKIQLKQGSILIFPSNFMFPHEVTQILKGSRYSFVSWVW